MHILGWAVDVKYPLSSSVRVPMNPACAARILSEKDPSEPGLTEWLGEDLGAKPQNPRLFAGPQQEFSAHKEHM